MSRNGKNIRYFLGLQAWDIRNQMQKSIKKEQKQCLEQIISM